MPNLRTRLTTTDVRMPIGVNLKLMRDRQNLVVVEQVAREHRADRFRVVLKSGPPATPALSTPGPMTAPFTGVVGASNLYGTTAHGCPVCACKPTSPFVSLGTYMSQSFRNSAMLHHENMLTALRLNEVERERRASARATRERRHRRRITRNSPRCPAAAAAAHHATPVRPSDAMSTPSSFAFICT